MRFKETKIFSRKSVALKKTFQKRRFFNIVLQQKLVYAQYIPKELRDTSIYSTNRNLLFPFLCLFLRLRNIFEKFEVVFRKFSIRHVRYASGRASSNPDLLSIGDLDIRMTPKIIPEDCKIGHKINKQKTA